VGQVSKAKTSARFKQRQLPLSLVALSVPQVARIFVPSKHNRVGKGKRNLHASGAFICLPKRQTSPKIPHERSQGQALRVARSYSSAHFCSYGFAASAISDIPTMPFMSQKMVLVGK
jgi:hypothetical protein